MRINVNRKKKDWGFTQLSNDLLRDKRLSAASRGVLGWLLSHSDEFLENLSRRAFYSEFNIGKSALLSITNNLKSSGYLETRRARSSDGLLSGWDWTIYEESQGKDFRRSVSNGSEGPFFVPSDRKASFPSDGSLDRRADRPTENQPSLKKTNSLENKKKKNIREGEKNAHAGSNTWKLFREVFPEVGLDVDQIGRLIELIPGVAAGNRGIFIEVLKTWKAARYNPLNFSGLADRYRKELDSVVERAQVRRDLAVGRSWEDPLESEEELDFELPLPEPKSAEDLEIHIKKFCGLAENGHWESWRQISREHFTAEDWARIEEEVEKCL